MSQIPQTPLPAIAVWIADPDMPGAARPLTKEEVTSGAYAHLPLFGSPAGCVLHAGVQASVFERPITREPYWDGRRIIANGWSTAGLDPDGYHATYKVVAIPGHPVFHPPLWPSDARLAA